jgi:hypothetical protein
MLQMKSRSSSGGGGGSSSASSHFAVVAAATTTTTTTAAAAAAATVVDDNSKSDSKVGLDSNIDYSMNTTEESDKAENVMIMEETSETEYDPTNKKKKNLSQEEQEDEENGNINSISNSVGSRRRKRERALPLLIISLIGVSIVIAATVGGVFGTRGKGNNNGGLEKSDPPTTISPLPMPPTSSPNNNSGGIPPPPTPPINNTTPTISPTSSPTVICYNVDIIINHDRYFEDTNWTISELPSNTIVEESPILDPNQSRTVCLKMGLYNFTIMDDYGDGLCCEWGVGNYTLIYQGRNDNDGGSGGEENTVIASGGVFNASESTSFRIPYVDELI